MSSDFALSDGQLAISVRGLGKMYQIYDDPRDRLRQALWRWRRQFYREFWALRDISFDVRRGEMLGIIGRNGSGKSTLLQIIAGTLVPTTGYVALRGRVAALLELGSGFHPEATGRENVFMNAAILGLSREQIEKRYRSIVAFADIGEFIDQPVKTYSSGMVMRLAFAVAAHVDADVLIVDEALAVGDEVFQRKCLGWLENFRAAGGTVLFVTHATETVVQLCERAILLHEGRILAHGSAKPVTDAYQRLNFGSPAQQRRLLADLEALGGLADRLPAYEDDGEPAADLPEAVGDYDPTLARPPEQRYGYGGAVIEAPRLTDERGRRVNVCVAGRTYLWRYRVCFERDAHNVHFGMAIKTVEGVMVAGLSSFLLGWRFTHIPADTTRDVIFRIRMNVTPGVYFLNAGVSATRGGEHHYLDRRVDVEVVRVVAPDTREVHGLAFLSPEFECLETAHVPA